jgi:26S proteasome regulatory subunit N5
MESREKAEFLLEQIRLCLSKKDYVRTEIIAKKVDTKQLNEDLYQDLKIKFYNLQIEYYTHFSEYFQICSAYKQIYNTSSIQNDETKWKTILQKLVLFSILSPFDGEISDILFRTLSDKKLFQLLSYRQLLEDYTSDEIMQWPLKQEKEMKENDIFADGK